jgi:hypothetical protein
MKMKTKNNDSHKHIKCYSRKKIDVKTLMFTKLVHERIVPAVDGGFKTKQKTHDKSVPHILAVGIPESKLAENSSSLLPVSSLDRSTGWVERKSVDEIDHADECSRSVQRFPSMLHSSRHPLSRSIVVSLE